MAKYEYTDKQSKLDAEQLLERTLRRHNWSVGLRDDVAAALRGIVGREIVKRTPDRSIK